MVGTAGRKNQTPRVIARDLSLFGIRFTIVQALISGVILERIGQKRKKMDFYGPRKCSHKVGPGRIP